VCRCLLIYTTAITVSTYEGRLGGGREGKVYWLNMLETISISASAAAIFSAEVGWGRAPPPKRKDILVRVWLGWVVMLVSVRVEG